MFFSAQTSGVRRDVLKSERGAFIKVAALRRYGY